MYPITVFEARYGGVYEGAPWIAVNLDKNDENWPNLMGDDTECHRAFWSIDNGKVFNSFGDKVFAGRGKNNDEAIADLSRVLLADKYSDIPKLIQNYEAMLRFMTRIKEIHEDSPDGIDTEDVGSILETVYKEISFYEDNI